MTRWLRPAAVGVLAALLFVTTVAGLSDAWDNRVAAETPLQRWFILPQLAYALTGLLAGVGVLGRRRWARWSLRAWGACITVAAGLAPIAWSGTGIGPALAAGVSAGAIATLLVLAAERLLHTRRHPAANPEPGA
jgi:hypothetical protein